MGDCKMNTLKFALLVTLVISFNQMLEARASPGPIFDLLTGPRGSQCERDVDCGCTGWGCDCNYGYCARRNAPVGGGRGGNRRRRYGGRCSSFRDCPFSQPCIGRRCYCSSPGNLPC